MGKLILHGLFLWARKNPETPWHFGVYHFTILEKRIVYIIVDASKGCQ